MAYDVRRRPVTLFALIIGIDDYANYQKLRGAVADAKAIKQYFEDVLQVPNDHIVTLYNDKATRDAIIAAIQKLQNDQRINKGDPIVVFYAGHGGELAAPAAWRVKNKIQCLIPQDCENAGNKPIPDRTPISGHRAPLPDRTIGVLIEDVAKAKGDNITVIFDCCHSASGTRVPSKDLLVPRDVDLDFNIPETLDSHIWQGRAGKIATGFAYHGLRSHVLLAACGEKERAYEDDRRGQFTKALLKTLESCAINNLDLTYTEVLERIHLEKQRPQCEGINRHRVFYGTRVPAGRQVWYPVRAGTDKSKYVVEAGLSHGVAREVEFALYNHQKLWLGVTPVDETSSIQDFESTIITSQDFKNVSFAKVARVGKVPLYLGNNSTLEETLRRIDGNNIAAAKFRIVGNVEEAKLHIGMENNLATFKTLDQRVQKLGLTKLPYEAALDSLGHVLGAAAHFFWYLDLENKNSQLGTNNEVAVNFYFLKRDYDDYGQPFLVPVAPGFCKKDPNIGKSDLIDFVVDPAGRYGIEIKNNTKRDLYLNAFLFNNSSLSVAPCYTQADPGKPEAPLKQGGTFTIGYGTGGTAPFSYSLEEGQDIDVGYLKLFLATRAIDLSDIEQMSPFSKVHPPPSRDRRDGVQPKSLVLPRADIWFTVLIPVVQRRGKKSRGVR